MTPCLQELFTFVVTSQCSLFLCRPSRGFLSNLFSLFHNKGMCDVNHCVCSHPCHTISVWSYFLLQLLCVLHLLFSLHVYECPMSVSMYYECQYFRLHKLLGIHYYTDFISSPMGRFATVLSLGEFLCVCWFYSMITISFPCCSSLSASTFL